MVGATIVLKGAPSVVASPGAATMTIVSGNPGLATGGSGDVLSGIIGALLGQGMPPERAAALGAQILGRSADLAGRRAGVRGLRPMDVIATVPELCRSWGRRGRRSVGSVQPPVLLDLPRPLA
jgi:NAD(P)H-hydrate epimerase